MWASLLGGGLEPPRLTAYAPQTYVSAISPPERFRGTQLLSCPRLPASECSVFHGKDGLRPVRLIKDSTLISEFYLSARQSIVLVLGWNLHFHQSRTRPSSRIR